MADCSCTGAQDESHHSLSRCTQGNAKSAATSKNCKSSIAPELRLSTQLRCRYLALDTNARLQVGLSMTVALPRTPSNTGISGSDSLTLRPTIKTIIFDLIIQYHQQYKGSSPDSIIVSDSRLIYRASFGSCSLIFHKAITIIPEGQRNYRLSSHYEHTLGAN